MFSKFGKQFLTHAGVIKNMTPVLLVALLFFSCKKDDNANKDCSASKITQRQIKDAKASVFHSGNTYYIVEQGTIDTKLLPCNLPQEFRIDKLSVIVSGDVKATVQTHFGVCCTEEFVITQISK